MFVAHVRRLQTHTDLWVGWERLRGEECTCGKKAHAPSRVHGVHRGKIWLPDHISARGQKWSSDFVPGTLMEGRISWSWIVFLVLRWYWLHCTRGGIPLPRLVAPIALNAGWNIWPVSLFYWKTLPAKLIKLEFIEHSASGNILPISFRQYGTFTKNDHILNIKLV